MTDFLLRLDYWLFELINQKLTFDFGDQFFPWVTDLHHNLYFKLIVIPLLIFLFVKFYKKLGLILFAFLVLAASWTDFSGSVVKNHYLRLRPFENPQIVATQKSPAGSKSFYSNHTSSTVNLATFAGNFIPALRIPLFTVAAVVAYSRVYNGVHYPSDVFAGALMGLIWGNLFSSLAARVLKKVKAKKIDPEKEIV